MVINKRKNQSFGMYVSPQVIRNLRRLDVPKNEVEKTIRYLQKLKTSSETKLVKLEVGKFNQDNFDVISANDDDIIERAFFKIGVGEGKPYKRAFIRVRKTDDKYGFLNWLRCEAGKIERDVIHDEIFHAELFGTVQETAKRLREFFPQDKHYRKIIRRNINKLSEFETKDVQQQKKNRRSYAGYKNDEDYVTAPQRKMRDLAAGVLSLPLVGVGYAVMIFYKTGSFLSKVVRNVVGKR